MRLYGFVAIRFLVEQRAQSSLIVFGVGVGVGVMVFISALISGLQASLIERTLGSQPHVIVEPREERARPLVEARPEHRALARRIEVPEQRLRSIGQWQKVSRIVRALPGVTEVTALAEGSGYALRGNASRVVAILGVDPDRFDAIIPTRTRMVEGTYDLESTNVVLGMELATELGASVGDRIRIQSTEGEEQLVTIAGLFDFGNRQVNQRWVLMSLRNGQTLLGIPGGASMLYVSAQQIYEAEDVAERIRGLTGLSSRSWMTENAQLLTALKSQSASTTMIRFFVILAVAIGITSVLVVSVVQRSREIGILRAMGMSRGTVQAVFLVQGGLIGLAGSIVGSLFGAALALGFARLAPNPDGSALFPVTLDFRLFAVSATIATLTGVLAALFPASRAARLDPAEAMLRV